MTEKIKNMEKRSEKMQKNRRKNANTIYGINRIITVTNFKGR
jgi:hypothetical protein